MRTKVKSEEASGSKSRVTRGSDAGKPQPKQRENVRKREGAYLDERVPHRRYAG